MGRMLKQQEVDKDVYTLGLERAVYTFDRFDHVAVMFSGGKDSTATLHVALDALHANPELAAKHLPLRVIFFDEEAIPYETEEYVRRIGERDDVQLEWYCLPVQHRNACSRKSPWWWPWAPEAADRWCRPLPPEAITHLDGFPMDPPEARITIPDANGLLFDPKVHGNAAMMLGIRAQESLNRRRVVTMRSSTGDPHFIRKFDQGTSRGNVWKSYPVYDWTTDDVWTAPGQLGWDYNRAYDRLEMAGVSAHNQRCSPAFGEEPLQKLHTYAACFPEVWDKMVDRVPGVGAAARYALTELYSYGSRPDKPAGMPWPEFIMHYIGKFEPDNQRFIAKRLKQELQSHYRKTSLPIVVNAPHPVSGVSWSFLLMLAMRGDFKGRKAAGGRIFTDDEGRALPKYWHKYATELGELIGAGTYDELAAPVDAPDDPFDIIPEYAKESDA